MLKIILVFLMSLNLAFAKLKIATFPYKIVGDKKYEQLIEKVESAVKKASAQEAKIIVFPELISLDLLVSGKDETLAKRLDESAVYFDKYKMDLKGLSKKYNIEILGGSFHHKNKKLMNNTAIWVTPKGRVELQEKIYMTPWERSKGWPDSNKLNVIHTDWGRFAILICHDIEFPDLSLLVGSQQVDVLLVPSQTDDLAGLNRVTYTARARAVEQIIYVINVGTTGLEDAPWHSYKGNSNFFVPQLTDFYKSEISTEINNEDVFVFELDIEKMRAAREITKNVYPLRDQKNRKNKIMIEVKK